MGKIEESNEHDTVQVKKKDEDVINEVDKKNDTPRIEEIGETKETLKVCIFFVSSECSYSCGPLYCNIVVISLAENIQI